MLDIRNNTTASVYVFFPRDQRQLPSMPVVDAARDIVAAGMGVEIFVAEQNYVPFTPERIEQLKGLRLQAKTLTCHTDQFEWNPAGLEAEIRLAAGLGAQMLVVHAATFGLERCDNPPPPETLRDICRRAMDSGVRIAFENSGRSGVEMLRRALDVIGADPRKTGMGICIDTGHANRSVRLDGMRAHDYLREFRDVIIEVHVNDNLGEEDLHLPPGQGTIEWNAVRQGLREMMDETVLCVELAGLVDDPLGLVLRSREFLCASPLSQNWERGRG